MFQPISRKQLKRNRKFPGTFLTPKSKLHRLPTVKRNAFILLWKLSERSVGLSFNLSAKKFLPGEVEFFEEMRSQTEASLERKYVKKRLEIRLSIFGLCRSFSHWTLTGIL
jgi:hypothetical protein